VATLNDNERLIWGKYLSAVATSRRMELEALDELLNEIGKPIIEEEPKAEKPSLEEINSLKSTEKTSSKGQYQLITKTENSNNPAFQKLQSYLKEHNGFVPLHGLKLWLFSNDAENKIGYKKQ